MIDGTAKLVQDPSSELAFGLVAAAGADLESFERSLTDRLNVFGYHPHSVRLSSLLQALDPAKLGVNLIEEPEHERIRTYMDAGNAARRLTEAAEVLALWAISHVSASRTEGARKARSAFIFRGIKHPDEARAFRAVYGPGFFLIALHASESQRKNYLKNDKGCPEERVKELLLRDEGEANDFGQQTRRAFELSDVFIRQEHDREQTNRQIDRLLQLIFGHPFVTPSQDEMAMFLAYSSSLRSASLSRQVGAVVWRDDAGVVASGCNDVPAAGGGLYWPNDNEVLDQRDFRWCAPDGVRGRDSNHYYMSLIAKDVASRAVANVGEVYRSALQKALGGHADQIQPPADIEVQLAIEKACHASRLLDVSEYGRAVHAEMDALLACARASVRTKGAALFSTTFPCHNCAKHIVAAGIERVVYIEPYPKSQALDLHKDAIILDDGTEPTQGPGENPPRKVVFQPFVGVGPRRFFDLFSMRLSTGYPLQRKKDERATIWERSASVVARVPMLPTSYLEREKQLAQVVERLLERVQ